jgi:enamidase
MISAGEVHLPGRPKDIVGLKALAITAQRAFDNFRPGGVKVLAGAPVIEKGMVESDFAELAAAGVKLLGEIGLGSVKGGTEAARWSVGAQARHPEHHPHRRPVDPGLGADRQGRRARSRRRRHRPHQRRPYVAARAHVCELCEKSSAPSRSCTTATSGRHRRREGRDAAEVPAPRDPGHRRAGRLGRAAAGHAAHDRLLSALADIPAELVFCFATGNTARMRGLNCGLIETGRDADFVFLDRAQHTAGRTCWRACGWATCPAWAW